MPIPIILQLPATLCPGDVVVMTVIPREIYRQYPGKFDVSVQTPHRDVWENNPFISGCYAPGDTVPPKSTVIPVGYNPRDEQTGTKHFMHSYLDDVAGKLRAFGVEHLALTEFRPCLTMSEPERVVGPNPRGVIEGKPYWLILEGGKRDITTKWWDFKRWQQVAYALASDEEFPLLVQVGRSDNGAEHGVLKHCVNLLDRTSLRELIWLTQHSRGVICGMTCLMHIAAALRKPCVVVAGGREGWWWDSYDERAFQRHKHTIPEAYHKLFPLRPKHICLDSIGRFGCCKQSGCWKVGIGEKAKGKNCEQLVLPAKHSTDQSIPQPRCMLAIKPRDVLRAVVQLEKGQ